MIDGSEQPAFPTRPRSVVMMRLSLVIFLASTLITTVASAQTSYPMVMSLSPVATQVGQTTEHTISSRYDLAGATEILITGSGVRGEILPHKDSEKDLTRLKVKFQVEPDALPGVRDFRLITPRGASTLGQLVVGRDPVIAEQKKNDRFDEAQMVELPATLCGAIEGNEDVDYYQFHLDKPTNLTFHVRSATLQDKIHDLQTHSDPIITLKNAAGVDLAQLDNFYAADPLLHYQFKQPGDYYLEIRDVRYQGNRYWEYSIEVHHRPFLKNVYPLSLVPGQATKLQLVGYNLPQTEINFTLPKDTPLGEQQIAFELPEQTLNPVPVLVHTNPSVLETSAANDEPATAQLVELPVTINGRMEKKADLDYYRFSAKKGERFTFEVHARRYQSSLDPTLRILTEKERRLSENDDLRDGVHTYADSRIENWQVPADGDYLLEVRDLQLRGGNSFVYALTAEVAEPNFELYVDTDKSQLTPGNAAVVFVRADRKNGFQEPIQLQVENLPPGVSAECSTILPDQQDGVIIFSCPADTKPIASNLHIFGVASLSDEQGAEKKLTVTGQTLQEIYRPGGGRGHWPVHMHTLAVCEPLDILSIRIEPKTLSLKPGDSQRIEITIERAEGFDKNVTLDVLYRHLNRNYGENLPKGVTLDKKNSKTLLNAKESKGHITLVASKDASEVKDHLIPVMAHVAINFVMKATYVAPLKVSVRKPDSVAAR